MALIPLLANDIVLDDSELLRLGFEGYNENGMDERIRFDVDRALGILREDQALAARLLKLTEGGGSVLWAGQYSGMRAADGSHLGVSVKPRKDGDVYSGENLFGRFLQIVATRYRRDLSESEINEVPVRDGQVVVDFTRKGEFVSDIARREDEGERFIHTDVFIPTQRRFDVSRDGTTGHNSRRSADDVDFKRFDCPFGTGYPSPIRVGSAAEASFLYEKGIRGELDMEATLRDLEDRGLIERMTERKRKTDAAFYRAQFAWMREQICLDPQLRKYPIVAQSLLVPDTSLGRSVYHPVYAPSPAHVLARYINNPNLLFQRSENGVLRALSQPLKFEQEGFEVSSSGGTVHVLVVGSDTIAGRVPGSRATTRKAVEQVVNDKGETLIREVTRKEFQYKSKADSEADYEAFAARLDETLKPFVDQGMEIVLITGNQSKLSNTVGAGTPQQVARYVQEKGGEVSGWNFTRRSREPYKTTGEKREVTDDKISAVVLGHFMDCYPVIAGKEPRVAFNLVENDDDTKVSFTRESGLVADCGLCFSVSADASNRNVLSVGSYAVGSGLPLVHVQENRTVEEQRALLSSGSVVALSALSGEVEVAHSMFDGNDRMNWDFNQAQSMSWYDRETGVAVPFVANDYPVAVSVASYSFKNAYAAYVALMAVAVGEGSRHNLMDIQNAGNSSGDLAALERRIVGDREVSDIMQEKALRQAVRLMIKENPAFQERLLSTEGRDLVMPATNGDTVLFTDLDGHGANRFAMVLASERDNLLALREASRIEEEERRKAMMEEANRKQFVSDKMKARFQKVPGGVPRTLEEARDAVWFMGTCRPEHLFLPVSERTFETWNEMGGSDPLVREKAGREMVSDEEGGLVPNSFHFLFPSDMEAVVGRRKVTDRADSRDLTGVTRVDPKTGESYVCATGIPVRYNNRGNDFNNDLGLPCSYILDNSASRFADSMVVSLSRAMAEAHRHGNALCMVLSERKDGTSYYPMGYQFMDKYYSKADGKWVPNPHRAPVNLTTLNRAISILENGRNFPLTCVTMPARSYRDEDSPESLERFRNELAKYRDKDNIGKGMVAPHFFTAEGRFLADLQMSLKIANAMAVSLGVELRFPLDENNHYDLGPGVPASLRKIAEQRIDSFIGVVREEDVARGELPVLERVPLHVVGPEVVRMEKSGTTLDIHANDLVYAFGQYEFDDIFKGKPGIPLHEMGFRMEDGTLFKLQDTRTTLGMDTSEINPFLTLTDESIRSFSILSTDVDKVETFLPVLRSYIERAKRVKVEARLVREGDPGTQDYGMKGYVRLLSSNSDEFGGSYTVKVDRELRKELEGVSYSYGNLGLNRIHTGESVPELDGMVFRVKDGWCRLKDVSQDGKRQMLMEVSHIGKVRDCLDAVLLYVRASESYLQENRLKQSKGETDEAFSARVAAREDVIRQYGDMVDFLNGDFKRNFKVRVETEIDYAGAPYFEARRFDMETIRTYGREMNIYNLTNRFDGTDNNQVYFGKVDANDGFTGWAQLRYLLPDGKQSDWFVVEDDEMALDMVLSMVHRTYKFNDAEMLDHTLPSPKVMRILQTGIAVAEAGEDFRKMDFKPEVREVDDKIAVLERPELSLVKPDDGAERTFDTLNVWAGTRENVELSNFAPANVPTDLPDGTHVVFRSAEQRYQYMKSYHCDLDEAGLKAYRDSVLSTVNGRKLKELSLALPLRSAEWDALRDSELLAAMRVSFDPALNPDRAEALRRTGDAVITHRQADEHWAGKFPEFLMLIRDENNRKLQESDAKSFAEDARVFVSYYGSRSIPDDAVLVQISTSRPKGLDVDVEFESMYPDFRTMVGPHKKGEIDDAGYTERYRRDVLERNRDRILEGVRSLQDEFRGSGRDIYLMCYCKPGDFCHRYIVANFLNENGIECRENPADRVLYKEGHVKLVLDDAPKVPEQLDLFPKEGRGVSVVSYDGNWDRDTVAADSRRLYVFTDNTDRDSGSGVVDRSSEYYRRYGDGKSDLHYPKMTAAVIRGLDNAVPVSTQRWYHEGAKGVSGRWNDADAEEFRKVVHGEFEVIREKVSSGMYDEVVFPDGDGLFNGRISAISEERTPALYGILRDEYDRFVSFCEGEGRFVGLARADSEIRFTESSGGYQVRTLENANADDVDFTFALAVDFSTYGEKATKRAAGSSYVGADIPLREDGKGVDLSREAVSDLAEHFFDRLPEEYQNGQPFGVNLAGNGIYTLSAHGVSQQQVDDLVCALHARLKEMGVNIVSYRSGGQTGVDQSVGALNQEFGLPVTVHAPKGFLFRDAEGKDLSGEAAFRKRFDAYRQAPARKLAKVGRGI